MSEEGLKQRIEKMKEISDEIMTISYMHPDKPPPEYMKNMTKFVNLVRTLAEMIDETLELYPTLKALDSKEKEKHALQR